MYQQQRQEYQLVNQNFTWVFWKHNLFGGFSSLSASMCFLKQHENHDMNIQQYCSSCEAWKGWDEVIWKYELAFIEWKAPTPMRSNIKDRGGWARATILTQPPISTHRHVLRSHAIKKKKFKTLKRVKVKNWISWSLKAIPIAIFLYVLYGISIPITVNKITFVMLRGLLIGLQYLPINLWSNSHVHVP